MAKRRKIYSSLARFACLSVLAFTVALSTVPRCLVLGELFGLHKTSGTQVIEESCHEQGHESQSGSRISSPKLCRCDLLDLSTSCLPQTGGILSLQFVMGQSFEIEFPQHFLHPSPILDADPPRPRV